MGVVLRAGDVVGTRYRIVGFKGEGGMASTYKAMRLDNNQPVVLKVPLFGEFTRENRDAKKIRLCRFEREADTLKRLNHENIPQFYERGTHGGLPFIAMEYIDGVDLRQYLRFDRPRVTEMACLAVSVARALKATHTSGVLHRDIKPGNIMVSRGGRVYVIDFGIALPTEGDPTRHTRFGVGTTGYKAPEQILRSRDEAASDLYSLGCVLYLMLGDREPFDVSEDELEVNTRHINDLPERLADLARGLPAEVDNLVHGLLEKDFTRRPTCDDVIEVMTPFLPAEGDAEPNPGFNIDLTLPYREPERARMYDGNRRSMSAPKSKLRRSRQVRYLTRDTIRSRIVDAERQVTTGDIKSADTSLRELLAEAIATYGRSHEMVRTVHRALAEVERLV